MLQFGEQQTLSTGPGAGVQPVARAPAPQPEVGRSVEARQRRRQARHQRPDRRQPAGAVQVQVGVGEVPFRLRQSLDAAGNPDEPRHRAVERPQRADRRRAPHRQAQPRLLRDRGLAGGEQHRARHLPPHHRAGVPPVPAAAGVRGGDPHPRLPVHRREPAARRGRDLQRLPRDTLDPRQGRVPDPVHRHADRSRVQDRHAGEPTRSF